MSDRAERGSVLRRVAGRGGPEAAAAVLLCLVLVVATVPTVQAAHQEDPNLSVYVPNPTVEPGTTMELTVQVENDARSLEYTAITAQSVRATMSSGDSPIVVQSGTQVVEPIADAQVRPVTFRIRVPRDISAGEYTLPIEVDYVYFEHAVNKSGSTTLEPTVRVDDRARFVVVGTESDVSVGDTGTLNVTIENVGSAPAMDGTMSLTSMSSAVTVGGSEADSRYVGRLAPGDRRTVSYEVSVAGDVNRQSYALGAAVEYEDTEGVAKRSPSLAVQLTPRDEQTFAVREVTSSLRVGEEGTVRGRVVNQGPDTVENAVAVIAPDGSNLEVFETEYVIGTLAPEESATFEYDVETSGSASDGPRQLTMRVRYRNAEGTQRQSEPIDVNVEVAPEQDVFDIEASSATIEAGGSGRLVLQVTNTGEEPVTDVSAKLFANDPLSSSNDEAFQSELGPGETREFVFQISGAAGALPKTYPASVDFQYDDADGDTLLSDTYRVPVTVVEPESGGGPPVLPIAVVVVVVLGGGYYLLRRRGRWPPWG